MDENLLKELPREMNPPVELRSRIEARLRSEGVLQRRRMPMAIAAAVVLLLAGAAFVIGVRQHVAAPPSQARYILLLYESPRFAGGSRQEYGAWAKRMRPLIVGGEELGGGDVLTVDGRLTLAPRDRSRLAGYFLIDARDDAAASRVARECPHIRHGGAVVLRKIIL